MPSYDYRALAVSVIDGDTLKLTFALARTRAKPRDLGLHVYIEQGWITLHESGRLVGINAPEHDTIEGQAAITYAKQWLAAHPAPYRARTERDRTEKYGRWLVTLTAADGHVLNADLVTDGQAVPWDGKGKRPTS